MRFTWLLQMVFVFVFVFGRIREGSNKNPDNFTSLWSGWKCVFHALFVTASLSICSLLAIFLFHSVGCRGLNVRLLSSLQLYYIELCIWLFGAFSSTHRIAAEGVLWAEPAIVVWSLPATSPLDCIALADWDRTYWKISLERFGNIGLE